MHNQTKPKKNIRQKKRSYEGLLELRNFTEKIRQVREIQQTWVMPPRKATPKLQESFKTKKHVYRASDIQHQRQQRRQRQRINSHLKLGHQIIKSIMMDGTKSDRKVNLQSLKSLISQLVNKPSSKKSLQPQTTHRKNITTQRKKQKRKNSTLTKIERQKSSISSNSMKNDQNYKKKLVQKLTSIKSMNTSLLKSQMDEPEEIFKINYNIQKQLNLETQNSFQLLDQMHKIESSFNKAKKNQNSSIKQREQRSQLDENDQSTQNIIATYLALLNERQQQQNTDISQQHPKQQEIDKNISQIHREQQIQFSSKKFQDNSINQRQQKRLDNIIEKLNQQASHQLNGIKHYYSSQIPKQPSIIDEIQKIKVTQLKKQQIQKWGFLLSFIKESMNKQQNTKDILNSVYQFLDRSKSQLQSSIFDKQAFNKQYHKNSDLASFTVQYSSKQRQSDIEEQAREVNETQVQQSQIQSFKEQYDENDQSWKLMNFEHIQNALKLRHKNLMQRKIRQMQALQEKYINNKLTESEFEAEQQKIQKWITAEQKQIKKAKKNIWKGYNEAKDILQKNENSQYLQSSKKKSMMRCLSDNYLPRIAKVKKNLLKRQSEEQLKSQSDNEDGQYVVQKQTIQQEDNNKNDDQFKDVDENQMQEIKQRLLNMKKNHYMNDEDDSDYQQDTPDDDAAIKNNVGRGLGLNYQQIQQDLQNSDTDDMDIILNKQIQKQQENQALQISKKQQKRQLQVSPKIQKDNRLKYMCSEDKQDIFEFIFLDLCIELYQQPCNDNKLMKAINKYVEAMKNQSKRRKGIKTALNVVKQYLKRFSNYIIRSHRDTLKGLNSPMGPTAIQMLRYMHQNDQQRSQQPSTELIIPINIFDQFEKNLLFSLQFEKYYDDEQKQNNRIQFLKNIMHIHNKAIFDALNEFLDQKRPFGIWGKPFPWKKSSTFFHMLTEEEQQNKLKQSCDKVGQYCSFVCGLLVDKEDSLVGNAKISEQYLESIKQDRLSRMLANDLIENQQRWMFFDDEETEVMVEISQSITKLLLNEVQLQIMDLLSKNLS